MNVITYDDIKPKIDKSVFLADNCRVIGSVEIGIGSSVWYGAVVRGDRSKIIIGSYSNIQDNAVIHSDPKCPCIIGDRVTVGHNAVVHGCTISSFCLIGIGSVVMNGAVIGEGSIVAAGSVVPDGKEFPPRSLIIGTPGRLVREITEDEYMRNLNYADTYIKLAESYLKQNI